ncbi:MAG: rRNA pseudouridine synthase, partial [Myxococcales bacterium]|nr:rRNA pseudouridine synthase [Myxococcales bacterium]
MSNVIRLDKLLSERGAGSRTLADRLIRRGRVTVDGVVITAKQTHVPIDAAVAIDGEPLLVPPVLIAWHKPAGVVSSVHDDHGRPDLALALPEEWRSRHHPVGRLDAETSGLLLFSGEGRLTQWLLHPRRAIEREYEAVVEGAPAPDLAARLAAGIPTADGVHVAQVLEQDADRVR